MEEETQRTLLPRPPKRGKKRQIIQSSPESNEQTAEVIRIRTPDLAKSAKPVNQPEHHQTPLQPPFVPATPRFTFSPPELPTQPQGSDKQYPYVFVPGYGEIQTGPE